MRSLLLTPIFKRFKKVLFSHHLIRILVPYMMLQK